jgi:predicted AAA+ superfamily ATPase
MIVRRLKMLIEKRLRQMPGVVLLGPRQIGKTTLARAIANQRKTRAIYLDLERPADRRRLANADAYLRAQQGKLVVIDEIHRAPALFEILRGIIDDRRAAGDRTGHFLLLGSASIDLMRQTAESLAGRVAYVELAPIDTLEAFRRRGGVDRLWVRGAWRQSFIRSYLDRDVPMFAPRLPAETIGRLWIMLAHAQGTPLNQSRLAQSLAVSAPAVGRYIDLLVDLLLLRRLRPWSGNVGKRLVRTPKVYVRDSGLAHALLDLKSWDDIIAHPAAGPSWEAFVIENLIAVAGDQRTPYYYRTEDGSEIDLLFERGGRIEMAIEIKRSTAPAATKGFYLACAVLKPKSAYLLHGGDGTWPSGSNVTAIAFPDLMRRIAKT